jgi:hypothetical protein
MNETISIRRLNFGCDVNVTRNIGDHKVHWKVRILDWRPEQVESAIKEARSRCDSLAEGIELAEREAR